jgi:hypothetical protein
MHILLEEYKRVETQVYYILYRPIYFFIVTFDHKRVCMDIQIVVVDHTSTSSLLATTLT